MRNLLPTVPQGAHEPIAAIVRTICFAVSLHHPPHGPVTQMHRSTRFEWIALRLRDSASTADRADPTETVLQAMSP